MHAVIYKPTRTAMQSGRGNTKAWVLEFAAETARQIDPLMGWTSSADTGQQVRLSFESQAAAEAFCARHGLVFTLQAPRERKVKPKNYSDNFSYYMKRGPGSEPLPRP
ncbi:MAG: ETC complex I subunit [Alphaproteobacteria bacterium]|nr:ETC complex I subunit [Alphaproteobacteria bacterium]